MGLRFAAVLLALVAAIGTAWLLGPTEISPSQPSDAPEAAEAGSRPAPSVPCGESLRGAKSDGVRPLLVVEGTVAFARGTPVPGRVRLALRGPEGRVAEGQGIDGRLTIAAPGAGTYAWASVEVEGEPYPFPLPTVEIREGSGVALVLDEPSPGEIDVVEAGSGTPLPNANAIRVDEDDGAVPGSASRTDRLGRIELPALWGAAAGGSALRAGARSWSRSRTSRGPP